MKTLVAPILLSLLAMRMSTSQSPVALAQEAAGVGAEKKKPDVEKAVKDWLGGKGRYQCSFIHALRDKEAHVGGQLKCITADMISVVAKWPRIPGDQEAPWLDEEGTFFKKDDTLAVRGPNEQWSAIKTTDCLRVETLTDTSYRSRPFSKLLLEAVGASGPSGNDPAQLVQFSAFLSDPRRLVRPGAKFEIKLASRGDSGSAPDKREWGSFEIGKDQFAYLNKMYEVVRAIMLVGVDDEGRVDEVQVWTHNNDLEDDTQEEYWNSIIKFEKFEPLAEEPVPAEVASLLGIKQPSKK